MFRANVVSCGLALGAIGLLLWCAGAVWAQTTAFTYQGKLTDGGSPANGSYDLQFKLFDTPTNGTGAQQGGTLVRNPVAASAGIFTVTLDFGASVFGGADRYLEIGVRPSDSGGTYTVLSPRQPITSSPYAIQTLNAQALGGVPADRYLASAANGNFGIGTVNPVSGRLHVEADAVPAVFGHSNANIGLWGTSTQLDGVRGDAYNASHAGVTGVHNSGGVGVYGTSAGAGVQGVSASGWGVVGSSTSAWGVVGSSSSSQGVHGESAGTSGFGVYAKNLAGYALGVEGHATQNLDRGGLVKAMLGVTGLGAIERCFNSLAGSAAATTVPCGFNVQRTAVGVYTVDFGFPVSDRFFSAVAKINGISAGVGVFNHPTFVNTVTVVTGLNGTTFDLWFDILVY